MVEVMMKKVDGVLFGGNGFIFSSIATSDYSLGMVVDDEEQEEEEYMLHPPRWALSIRHDGW